MTSARASGKVLPWSRVMRAASSSRCRQTSSRKAKKTWLRAISGVSRQAGKAARAAATAALDLGGPAARDAGDDLAGGRVVDRAGLLREDLDRPAVDPVGQDGQRRAASSTWRAHFGCHGRCLLWAMRQDARVRMAGEGGSGGPVSRTVPRIVAIIGHCPQGPVGDSWTCRTDLPAAAGRTCRRPWGCSAAARRDAAAGPPPCGVMTITHSRTGGLRRARRRER